MITVCFPLITFVHYAIGTLWKPHMLTLYYPACYPVITPFVNPLSTFQTESFHMLLGNYYPYVHCNLSVLPINTLYVTNILSDFFFSPRRKSDPNLHPTVFGSKRRGKNRRTPSV